MKHPVSGEIRVLSWKDVIATYDAEDWAYMEPRLQKSLELPGTVAIVRFVNLQVDSSQYGASTWCAVGPGRTVKLEDLERAECRLGDLPSRFQYPQEICYK